MDLNHSALCALAVKWLKRPNSANGHGCHVAVSECRSGWSGEVPDAIGFRQSGHDLSDGSVVVEVKVTRGDFLADRKKPHRSSGGLGNWRYYLCPEGLITPEELPPGWGLLWVNARGHIKPMAGFAAVLSATRHHGKRMDALEKWKQESNASGESFLLVKLLARVGDPEEVNQRLREASREASYWRERSRKPEVTGSLPKLEELRNLIRALPTPDTQTDDSADNPNR